MTSHDVSINSLTNSPTMTAELIHFLNVKTVYCLNEDILLEYALQAEVQPSFRDWIGLYPRGWTDIHQCVVFEWIPIRPFEVSLQRNILFHCRHHLQVVHTDREYQFVYVNRQLEILGRSLFFRFLETDKRNYIHTFSSENGLASSTSLDTDTTCNRNDHIQDQTHVKSSAELIRDLEDRIYDLENDLEVSQVAQKSLKLVAHLSEQKMVAFRNFVKDLCFALKQKGVVRVIDGDGIEMLVKQVRNTATQTNVTEGHPHQNVAEMCHKDPVLNSVIDCQAEVLNELLLCLDSTSKDCSNFARKVESVKQVVQYFIAVMSCRQEGVPVSDPCKPANHSLNFSSESPSNEVEPVCMIGNSEQRLGELTDKEAETLEFPDHCAEPVSEKSFTNVDQIIMTPWFLRSHLD